MADTAWKIHQDHDSLWTLRRPEHPGAPDSFASAHGALANGLALAQASRQRVRIELWEDGEIHTLRVVGGT